MAIAKRRRQATALSKQSSDPLWQTLDAKIGGRDGLLAAALSSSNPKAAILAEFLLDVAFKNSGTKDLARKAGLTAPEVVDLYRDRKWLEATLALHEDLPEVVRGAVTDAKPSEVPCEECKGINPVDCWLCLGKGTLRKPGDQKKLEFVGEAVGMTGKGGPVQQTNIQINTPSGVDSFETLLRRATPKFERKQIETDNKNLLVVGNSEAENEAESE